MKRMILALTLLLCLCGAASADLGDPTVQAVCRIKLTNGRLIEGFLTMGAGGYDGITPSGFRFEAGTHKATHFFLLDFKKLVRGAAGNYKIISTTGRISGEGVLSKPSKVVFLEWDGEHQRYEELDALMVVTELPYYLYIDPKYEGLRKGTVITIPLKRILSFELIDHPAKKWLRHIKEREQIVSERDDFEDYMEPAWYHEILRDKGWYDSVKEAIERGLKSTTPK